MAVKIFETDPKSKPGRKGISGGDILLSINGNPVDDFLDYSFYGDGKRLSLEFLTKNKSHRTVSVRHCENCDTLGLKFGSFLMDEKKRCRNSCVFCFVDRMPRGMRDSLYFKDDDFRLSFLFGNYITLTNLSEHDAERIIKMHLSPMNVSVHTMNPVLRNTLMRNPRAGESLVFLKKFSDAGIKINAQLVLCPGLNDGKELQYSLQKLSELPSVDSIAAVPVGMTRFREGLYPLESYSEKTAAEVIDIIAGFNSEREKHGKDPIAFASDEFFITAHRQMPSYEYYGDFPQLDNGVGGCVLLEREFNSALESCNADCERRKFAVATGKAAFPLIKKLAAAFCKKYSASEITVYCIENRFFGDSVTVAGLITGGDLISELKDQGFCFGTLVLPEVMLKSRDEKIFLDDISVEDVERELNTRVKISENRGGGLFNTFYSLHKR